VPSATFLENVAEDQPRVRGSLLSVIGGRNLFIQTQRCATVRFASDPSKEKYNMNNLHRDLAPISDSAWAQIEAETSRTLKRYLAGRRVVDVKGPRHGPVCCWHRPPADDRRPSEKGIVANQREVKALVELRVPFDLDRQAIDDVERGANDSDWQPAKDAARQLAFAEDGAIFEGYAAAGIEGIRKGTSNPIMALPSTCVSTRRPSRRV
jgi:uncharacterized linocin/CFP29 family protein